MSSSAGIIKAGYKFSNRQKNKKMATKTYPLYEKWIFKKKMFGPVNEQ